jgi:hypothetical protein
MLTITDIDAAFVEAEAQVSEWWAEFERQFNRPIIVAESMKQLLQMPPEQAQAFMDANPDLFGSLNKKIKRLKGMTNAKPTEG